MPTGRRVVLTPASEIQSRAPTTCWRCGTTLLVVQGKPTCCRVSCAGYGRPSTTDSASTTTTTTTTTERDE